MTRLRPLLLATVLAIGVPALLPAVGAAGAATAPAVVGTWRWSDADEALANGRNPRTLVVRARARGFSARFGAGRWVPLTWSPSSRTFTFTARRRVGQHGERSAQVAYRGRLVLRKGVWRARGTLRIRLSGFPGVSSFTATRRR